MHLYSSLSGGQVLVRTLVTALFLGGLVGLVAAARFAMAGKPYPRKRQPGPLAIASVIALAVAGIGYLATPNETARPQYERVNNAREFKSSLNPSLALSAPSGWTLDFDSRQSMVTATHETTGLAVYSAVLKEAVVPESLIAQLRPLFASQGLQVDGEPFADTVAGKAALGLVARTRDAAVCTWVVKRGTHFVSSVQCKTGAGDPRAACRPALQQLTWLAPSDVEPSAL